MGVLNTRYDIGRVELESSLEEIDEIVVEARKALVSSDLDRKTFNIADNPAYSGGSVLDALRGLPGITVTQEGKVLLRGSDKIAILIEGKQSSLTGFGNQKGLDNLPTSNIESIEIINNPSAKYDASGMAGIINIIYKKQKETGLSGEVGFTFGIGALTKQKADIPTDLGSFSKNPKYIPNLNLNYRTKKINIFLQSEAMRLRNLPNNEFTTRYYDDGRIIASQVPENRRQTHYILNGGLDWLIDENNTLTISGIYDWESHIDTAQVGYQNLISSSSALERLWWWQEHEVTGYMNYRFDYKHQFNQPGHELNATIQYTKGWEDEEYRLNDSSAFRRSVDTTHILAIEHTTNILLDYVKPLRSGRLEAGSKFQIRKLPVTYLIGQGENSIIYPGLGDWSEWGEDLYAGYLNYVLEKKKFDIEAGLRTEQTSVYYTLSPENIYYLENDAYSYFGFFPNIRLTWKINPHHGFSAFYNRRVDRPGEPELRVFPKYDDPELLKVGNPYLRPQFTQNTELAYKLVWNSGSLFMSGFHRIIDDPYLRIYSMDTTNYQYDIINKIYVNAGSARHTGLELLLSQRFGDFWKLSGSINWYNIVIDGYKGTMLFPYERPYYILESKDITWDLKINNQWTLPYQTQLQLTFLYYAPQIIPQGKQLSRSSLDIGIKKVFLNNHGEISLSFSDMFNRFGIRQEIQGEGFTAVYENLYETQILRLGFRYKF